MTGNKKYKFNPETIEDLKKQINMLMKPYILRSMENLKRVVALIDIYNDYNKKSSDIQLEDILRAAVVLLHASLEDFLRVLAASVIPKANKDVLNAIPLVGMSRYGRAEKFSLGDLAKHRGKDIDTIIIESVSAYLERESFNSIDDILLLLKNMRVNDENIKKYFTDIDAMIKRRHQIVHRADRIYQNKIEDEPLDSIDSGTVVKWAHAVTDFIVNVAANYGVEVGMKIINGIDTLED